MSSEDVETIIRELTSRRNLKIKQIERFYTPKELAHDLRVSERTIGRWVKKRLIEHMKVGPDGGKATIRFSTSGILKFLRHFTVKPIEENLDHAAQGGIND